MTVEQKGRPWSANRSGDDGDDNRTEREDHGDEW